MPAEMNKTRKANVRKRLKAVDKVIAVVADISDAIAFNQYNTEAFTNKNFSIKDRELTKKKNNSSKPRYL
ncbi:36365_t:CDS:2 [Gigaspora margarita]|uniref:36365_t:CDS:1 n=1 Tax=Gigaspora margarita TaxID=4874 RepID=A0ABN7VFW7_GIGMA|nr:36365_t:CDS:2 [Gigaspora margarita]